MLRLFFVYYGDMDLISFSPIHVGLASLWQCDDCGSLVSPEKDGLEVHIKWHDWLYRMIARGVR